VVAVEGLSLMVIQQWWCGCSSSVDVEGGSSGGCPLPIVDSGGGGGGKKHTLIGRQEGKGGTESLNQKKSTLGSL
jgi:hypothetical protein